MARTSERTEKLKSKLFWLRFFDILLLVTPIFYYFIYALASNGGSIKKATMVVSVLIALAIILMNLIMKLKLRSPLWLALFGLHIVLNSVQVLLFILFVFSFIDEAYLSPQINKAKQELIANKEMDLRLL